MKREIPESVANAIKTIKSFCDDGLYRTCDGCPFFVSGEAFCLFNRNCPACWNVDEEKHYYIECDERK